MRKACLVSGASLPLFIPMQTRWAGAWVLASFPQRGNQLGHHSIFSNTGRAFLGGSRAIAFVVILAQEHKSRRRNRSGELGNCLQTACIRESRVQQDQIGRAKSQCACGGIEPYRLPDDANPRLAQQNITDERRKSAVWNDDKDGSRRNDLSPPRAAPSSTWRFRLRLL
jgi:hypothetical protein